MIYKTIRNGKEIKFDYDNNRVSFYRNGEYWGSPQGESFTVALLEDIEKYRKEILDLRGNLHLSCPNCGDDCIGWVTDGRPCSKYWQI